MKLKMNVKFRKPLLKKALLGIAVASVFALGWFGKDLVRLARGPEKIDLSGKTVVEFMPKQTSKPKVEIFVMSFCPYGNQMEDNLQSVVDLLGDKVDWQPRYIVSKIDVRQACRRQVYSLKLCQEYVDKKYFPDVKSCRQRLYPSLDACLQKLKPQAIMADANNGYFSLHGRQEVNEDVREVCAWNLKKNVGQWWGFVAAVNKNCNLGNADNCWEKQAKDNGFDTGKIKQCFGNEALNILAAQEKASREKQASASPTVFINGVLFPPAKAYGKNSVLRIGKKVFSADKYREAETLKEAVCGAFSRAPRECGRKLAGAKAAAKAAKTAPAGNCGS